MHPKKAIQEDLKVAMKSGDNRKRDSLRMLMAAFKQVEVDTRAELSEDDTISILMTEAKKRREAIQEMVDAGRTELIEPEEYDLAIIQEYLPRQLTREEIEAVVLDVVTDSGANSLRDMGRVMKTVMERLKGQADGKLVSEIVRAKLN